MDYIAYLLADPHMRRQFEPDQEVAADPIPRRRHPAAWRPAVAAVLRRMADQVEPRPVRPAYRSPSVAGRPG
jgi:hypothetical protein